MRIEAFNAQRQSQGSFYCKAYNDPFTNSAMPFPFPEALQEFKVETSALPAQYGYHSGASVNAVTKSGTNQFHGDLFEFLRNGGLNARNFFAAKRDTLRRHQFGGASFAPLRPWITAWGAAFFVSGVSGQFSDTMSERASRSSMLA